MTIRTTITAGQIVRGICELAAAMICMFAIGGFVVLLAIMLGAR